MIINEKDESTYYGNPATTVYTIDKLPSIIQLKLNSVLSAYLGTLESSVYFIDAQVVNLDQYFKVTDVIKHEWITPKYDVHYYISIPSKGLEKYNVTIKLDQYGQLISINWPERGYKNISDFYDTGRVKKYAFEQAAERKLYTANCKVVFDFNKQFDEFCWQFSFYEQPDFEGKATQISISGKEKKIVETHNFTQRVVW
jgi:hypothetical protein